MAGVKGKSGGKGGRKATGLKRTVNISFRVTEEEKKTIEEARGELSLQKFFLGLIKRGSDESK